MNKKLQVFVSSTYTDLKEERQAAVQAILDAGHIPAGMELFKAGNESQLKTIYKWIDESDVYMLILGGRYGSIEEKSGKSYTQLEYEYALSKDIPVFALVLSESFTTKKITSIGLKNVIEQDNPDKYKSFKSFVMSKIIKEVDDCKDIKIQVHATLNEFMNTYDLIGWVRYTNENDTIQLLKDNANLLKETNSLNNQIQKLQEQLNEKSNEQLGNYSFKQLVQIFQKKTFVLPPDVAKTDTKYSINALDLFIAYYDIFTTGISNEHGVSSDKLYIFFHIMPFYISFNLLKKEKLTNSDMHEIQTTELGNSFYAMLVASEIINDVDYFTYQY